ncbi:MAG: polysaccharide pyruvyl transferase family protein [Bacteroidaceae bacterium]|nr:polysaccharide pyruvyl transferase family protein [Bacteroidaceae bacterium]
MKICTITCQNADNHGARLQCYALVRHLQKQGHDVKVIDYRPYYMRGFRLWYWPGISIKGWIKFFWCFPDRMRKVLRHRDFDAFSKKYIPLTRVYYCIEELRKDPPEADMYIAGSDQIWNTTFPNGTDPGYYLDFGSKEVRRESFAASFATTEVVPSAREFVKENLKRFDKITVREQSALKILEDLGCHGTLQEDPVFLLSAEEWNEIADGTGEGEKYVLVYDFYADQKIREEAQLLAKEKALKIYAICPHELRYADKNFVYAGPETFVSLIKNASYVVSNSFHGTVFAMIYHVPFKVVDRPDGLNVRMHDLLERHLC